MIFKELAKPIKGYSFSFVELIVALAAVIMLVILINYNISASRVASFDLAAKNNYDRLKQAIYQNMSSPMPERRYLMKNIVGPGPLPAPFDTVFLDNGIVVNYLIRVYEPRLNGQPKDQLRLEISHIHGRSIYRYVEINGVLTEQVVAKSRE